MKRKEWIKNFAIIFLAVLLVLTFFSNTIRNYSLPEVAAQYTQQGQITNKVRGQGMVQASDPYKVEYKQSRKVESVKVHVGDEVIKGDVLYELEAGESNEVKTAEKELSELQEQYYEALIAENADVVTQVTSGRADTNDEKIAKITALQKNIDAYQKEVDRLEKEQDAFLNGTPAFVIEKKNLEDLKNQLAAWREQDGINDENLSKAKRDFASVEGDKDVTDNDTKIKAYKDAKKALEDAESAKSTSEEKIKEYDKAVENAQKAIDDKTFVYSYQIKEYNRLIEQAKEDLSEITAKSKIYDLLRDIDDKKAEIEKLKETEGGLTITAPVDGTVLSLAYTAGETTKAGEEAATMQVAGKGYTMTMDITNEQASLIKMGDEAEVTNSWWYSDVHAKIVSIRPNPQNPASGKVVTFEVEGEVSNGQELSITVGSRTSSYDCIVPSSAIREDNNGKFIYRVVSKSTPLGNRYSVERVDVKVLGSDEKMSAVSGALEAWDYIVTTSSKPITDGQLVRLKD